MSKRTVLWSLGTLIVAVVIVIAAAVWWSLRTANLGAEEVINYRAEQVRAQADAQLEGIDREQVRTKAPVIMDKSAAELQQAVHQGELTYTELTAFYLDRIATIDQAESGVNSVTELNPKAMEQARAADIAERDERANKPLFGLSVLIKDNVNTKDMPTSAGTVALAEFTPAENAPVVDSILSNGAIVLGKAAMSEMANFMSPRMPTGYSGKQGQTHNPFAPLKFSPLGSSTGSAVSVAANMATVSIGTETSGSIIAPAAVNSVVGFKPSIGTIDAAGVIPLAATLDTVGTMGRSVSDAVALYNGSVEADKRLPMMFDADSLRGARIGFAPLGDEHVDNAVRDALSGLGAEVVEVSLDTEGIDMGFVMRNDLKFNFAEYAKRYNAPVSSLDELIDFNKQDMDRRARYGQDYLEDVNRTEAQNPQRIDEMFRLAHDRLDDLMRSRSLNAIVTLDNLGSDLACMAGAPQLTVPMGTDDTGLPHGATFIARYGDDATVADYAYAYEQATTARQIPQKYLDVLK